MATKAKEPPAGAAEDMRREDSSESRSSDEESGSDDEHDLDGESDSEDAEDEESGEEMEDFSDSEDSVDAETERRDMEELGYQPPQEDNEAAYWSRKKIGSKFVERAPLNY